MKACSKVCLIFVSIGWVILASIYIGVLVGVWMPILKRDWHDAQCIVKSLNNYKFVYEDEDGETISYYTSIAAKVEIDNHWVSAFACGTDSPSSYTLGSTTAFGGYPYQAVSCTTPDICGKELMLPAWYCSDCKICQEKLTGQPEPCKWSLFEADGSVHEPSSWSSAYSPPFPTSGSSYIQVVLGTSVYYSQAEFIALHVCCGVGLIGAIFFCLIVKAHG